VQFAPVALAIVTKVDGIDQYCTANMIYLSYSV